MGLNNCQFFCCSVTWMGGWVRKGPKFCRHNIGMVPRLAPWRLESSGNTLIQQPRWFGRRSIIKPENYVGRENNTSHALTAAAADILWNSKRTLKLVGLMSIRGFSLSCTRHSSLSVESIPLFQRRRRRRPWRGRMTGWLLEDSSLQALERGNLTEHYAEPAQLNCCFCCYRVFDLKVFFL